MKDRRCRLLPPKFQRERTSAAHPLRAAQAVECNCLCRTLLVRRIALYPMQYSTTSWMPHAFLLQFSSHTGSGTKRRLRFRCHSGDATQKRRLRFRLRFRWNQAGGKGESMKDRVCRLLPPKFQHERTSAAPPLRAAHAVECNCFCWTLLVRRRAW